MSVKAFLFFGALIVFGILAVGASNPDLMRPAGIVGGIALVVLVVADTRKGKGSDSSGSRKSAKAASRR